MRVLLAVERFAPRFGGAERYAVDLARGLSEAGVSVQVATQDYEDVPEGVKVIPIRPLPWPKGLRVYDFGVKAARVGSGFDVVHGLVKAWGVDVFHPHTGSHRASLAALLESHVSEAKRWAASASHFLSPKQAVFRWIENQQYGSGRVKIFVAVSRMVARDMGRRHGVPHEDIRVLYNPVDTDRFRPDTDGRGGSIRARHGIDAEEFLCLFVAHHFRLKGLDTLLRGLARMGRKAPRLLVLGRGKQGPYRRKARSMGLEGRVVFAGEQPEPETYYRAADAFILPTYYDPCSLTVLEAMASGIPVITTSRNGASELIDPGHEGFILEDPSREDHLASFIEALADPRRRREMGSRARDRATTLTPREHLEAVLEIYEASLKK